MNLINVLKNIERDWSKKKNRLIAVRLLFENINKRLNIKVFKDNNLTCLFNNHGEVYNLLNEAFPGIFMQR